MNILVRKNNQERGPYTEAELRERLKSGVFSGSDLGRVEGDGDWKPLSEILLASVLATEKSAEAPTARPASITTYSWLRHPKIIGGAIVLLLLIFGGINWLNKASEKRRENAIAARQAAAMEQAQKQTAAMLQQQQEQSAKARQAQLDQMKQMMAYSEKAQKDYQQKEKQRLAEQEKARQAREQEEQRTRQEALRREEEERQRAQAEQKRQEEKRLAALQKAAAPTATPSLIGQGSAPWRDARDAANYVLIYKEIWNIATGVSAGALTRWSGTAHLVANHPNLLLFHEKEKMTAGFTDSPPHLVSIGVEKANSPPIDNNASNGKAEALMASDYRRMVIFENGDIWRAEFDWAKNDIVNKKRLTTNGLFSFGHTKAVLWYGNNLYLDAKLSEVKPIVKVDLLTGSLEEIPTYDVFTHRSNTADRVMSVNPTGDLCFVPHGSVLNTYDARTGKAATVRASVEIKEHGRPVPIEVVTAYGKLEWIDSDTALSIEGDRVEHPLIKINVRTGASTVLDDRPGKFDDMILLPGGQFVDVVYKPREVNRKKLPAERYLIDVTNGTRTKLPFLPEMPRHWLNAELCIYGKTGGGINEVGTWLFNRATNQVKKLCSTPCDKTFAKLLPNGGEVCFSATVNGQHLCRVKLNGEDFTQLPCGEYAEAMATPPVDLGLDPDSKPLWQPVSAAPQQQSAETEAQQQTAAQVATQREVPEATPQQQPAETKPQQPSVDKPGDWITVMDAIKNEPPEMQEWAKKAYDYATGNIFLNDFYDPAKLTLKFMNAHRARPEAHITDIVSKTDYKDCVSRPKVEQWAYLRTFDIMRTNLPPAQLEKAASEVGRLVADAYVANPVPTSGYKERLYNNALTKVRHTLLGTPQNPGGSTPAGNESTAVGELKAIAKRPTPNPSPLAVAYADPRIQMEDLGPMPKDLKEVAVSSDGLHVAVVIPSGGGQVVYYDGKPGPQYDNVAHFMSGRSPAVVFSKDGTHAAYLAVRGESQFVWADGKETALTSRFRNSGDARSITLGPDAVYFKFSPGGEHLAYACDTDAFQREIVVDGAEGRAFHRLYPIVFSEQGGHYAYVGKPNQTESLVVVDGIPGPVFSDIKVGSLRLSPDGTHYAYISTKETSGNSWFVVLDGNEQRSYENIEFLQFSSTGHCAYVGVGSLGDGAAYGSAVVVDGKQVAEYRDDGRGRNVEQLQFSPDGNRLAYVAKTPDGVAVFVDGKQGHSYDGIDPNSVQFSPDSSGLTYYAKRGSDRFVVTDGRESPPVGKVFKFTYAEKANTAAFIAAKEPGGIAVVDNQPSKNYRFCHDIALSPNGSRYAYAMSGSIGHPDVVVDGRAVSLNPASFEEPAWGTDLKTAFRFSPDNRHLAMAAMGRDGIGQIISVDGRAGPQVGACQRFVFSPDSAHFAYLDLEGGPKGTTTKIMLDHKPVQTFGPQLTMMVFAAARERARELPPPDSRSAPATAALPQWFTFRSDNKLKFLATKDGKIYRVTITPGAPTGGPVIAKTASQPGESKRSGESLADQGLVSGTATGETSVSEKTNVTEGAATDDSAVSGIAEQMAQALSSGDIDALGSLYGDSVDYLDSGRITSDAVRTQLQQYFERWPARQWAITGPARVTSLGASRKQITFTASYDVSDSQSGRHSSGRAKETLILAPDTTGAMKIVSQHEKTTRSDTPTTASAKRREHEKVYRGKPVDRQRPIIPIPPNIPWPPGIPHP